jgi:preprotein translocase subunit SecA
MLALSCALMGNFVDVITSSKYLASRDEKKVKAFFSLFGITSSSITSSYPTCEEFNGIILYGCNSDYEFAILRDGLSIEKRMMTTPYDGNMAIPRRRDVAIVDESDNMFLDTAGNSARIASDAIDHFEWVYKPIFEAVSKKNITSLDGIRKVLVNFNEGVYETAALSISDETIKTWIDSAHHALKLNCNVDYVLRRPKPTLPPQVVIVDVKNTGRLEISSRWSGGLHEMVEVKVGMCLIIYLFIYLLFFFFFFY